MAPVREQVAHLQVDTFALAPPLRLPASAARGQPSGAQTDRGARSTFHLSAAHQLGRDTERQQYTTYGGQLLHSPRNRDDGNLSPTRRGTYRAPGSPRNQVELFYIRSNMRGPREVRLLARRKGSGAPGIQSVYPSPRLANATLAQLSPRRALAKAGIRAPRLFAVNPGDDWLEGWQKNGARLQGEGVKWSGRLRREPGDTSVFVSEPVAILSPRAGDESMFWTRGAAMQRKDPPKDGMASASPASLASLASSEGHGDTNDGQSPLAHTLFEASTRKSGVGTTGWPRTEGSPWKSFVKNAKKRERSFEDEAEKFFGEQAVESDMKQPNRLRKNNEHLTRLPRQWLHKSLIDISLVACRLESLPSSLGDYAINVTSLILEHNMLSELPDSVAKMTKLKFLGLTANQFSNFPEVIGSCTALQVRSKCQKRFRKLICGCLSALTTGLYWQVLSMQCNKLEAVKPCIGYCRQLRALYLKGNPLKKLALSIGALKELSILSYNNTETMAIPPCEVRSVSRHNQELCLTVLCARLQASMHLVRLWIVAVPKWTWNV